MGYCSRMATYQDGNVRKATANTVKAMHRSAESRKCPECGRKSALKFLSDEVKFGRYCRWMLEGKCTYEHWHFRDTSHY
jgi:hypothetical protein